VDTKHVKPIVLDVGKKSKKALKRLKRGDGELVEQAEAAALSSVAAAGGNAKDTITVVVLYQKKSKKKSKVGLASLIPLP
jgi:hypothetical protein